MSNDLEKANIMEILFKKQPESELAEQILKIKNERAEKEREEYKERCWENYENFYSLNKCLPLNAERINLESIADENKELFKMVKNWNRSESYGFCICGPVGTGKTFALTAILNHVALGLVEDGYAVRGSIYWNTASMLLEELKDSYNKDESSLEKIIKIQSYPYLFIDDFGAHKFSDFSIEKLISILDYRVNNFLPTFFSTNCKIDQMKSIFGERIFSRIIATSVMVEITGKDRRIDVHLERLKKLREGKNI